MLKKLLSFTVSFAMISSFLFSAAADIRDENVVLFLGSSKALVKGVETKIDEDNSVVPVEVEGRTLVPLRFVSKSLGATVDWDEFSKQAIIKKDEKTILFTDESKTAFVNSEEKTMDVFPRTIGKRLMIPIRFLCENLGFDVNFSDGLIVIGDNVSDSQIREYRRKINVLPRVLDEEDLRKLMGEENSGIRVESSGGNAVKQMALEDTSNEINRDYSKTNIQEEGIDEGDIVKCDGESFFILKNKGLKIVKAYPASDLDIISEISFDENEYPYEMYLDGNLAVVFTGKYVETKINDRKVYDEFTKIRVIDVENKAAPEVLKESEIEGYYNTSRKKDNYIYFINNSYCYDAEPPAYLSENGTYELRAYTDIMYFPGCKKVKNYITVGAFDMRAIDKPINYDIYLGNSDTVYMSENNLYIASANYNWDEVLVLNKWKRSAYNDSISKTSTDIYKFALDGDKTQYVGKGEIEGTLLNQFSLSEYDNHLRVASTSVNTDLSEFNGEDTEYGMWMYATEENSKIKREDTNNIIIFDDMMNVVGFINDIAQGERIYSARFMKDRAYLITYKNTDPLFTFDLSVPSEPKLIGEVKVDGFSNYLHPLDENHLIGIGRDTDKDGKITGLKLSLYDVTDMNNPKEQFKEVIKGNIYSKAFYDSKALTYDKDNKMLMFPAQIYTENNSQSLGLIYKVSADSGFEKMGEIRFDNENYDNWIERMLYINEAVYSLSNKGLSAFSGNNNYKLIKSVDFSDAE